LIGFFFFFVFWGFFFLFFTFVIFFFERDINGCVGGQAAQTTRTTQRRTIGRLSDKESSDAGATANQVQAIWMEQVIPGISGEFPAFAKGCRATLRIASTMPKRGSRI